MLLAVAIFFKLFVVVMCAADKSRGKNPEKGGKQSRSQGLLPLKDGGKAPS